MITYILISYVYMMARSLYGCAKEDNGKEWVKLFLVAPLSLPVIFTIDLINW